MPFVKGLRHKPSRILDFWLDENHPSNAGILLSSRNSVVTVGIGVICAVGRKPRAMHIFIDSLRRILDCFCIRKDSFCIT